MTATRTAPQPTTLTQRMDRPAIRRGSREVLRGSAATVASASPNVTTSNAARQSPPSPSQPSRRTAVPPITSTTSEPAPESACTLAADRRDATAPDSEERGHHPISPTSGEDGDGVPFFAPATLTPALGGPEEGAVSFVPLGGAAYREAVSGPPSAVTPATPGAHP